MGFFLYGWNCWSSERMAREFERFGLATLRRPTGALEVAGSIGLVIGYVVPVVGTLAAAGLTLLMAAAIATRLRVRDPLAATLPALAFGGVIAYALGFLVATGRWR